MTSSPSKDELLRTHASVAARRLRQAGEALARRQRHDGPARGNVPPWPGSDALDFHGTLAAMWIWARTHALAGGRSTPFAGPLQAGWGLVRSVWGQFIPDSLASASDEAPYDCAMVLRAALADPENARRHGLRELPDTAARLLGAFLGDLDDLSGREFRDPGFLVFALAAYARAVGDRGLLATARRFVDRAFGMKAPAPFASEPSVTDGLFDFSSTTATRVLAVVAGEGATPFVGAWLRERVLSLAPAALVSRSLDENAWNACVAAALGRAFVVSTDPGFLRAHQALVSALEERLSPSGALGRGPGAGIDDETRATFYFAMAVDSLCEA